MCKAFIVLKEKQEAELAASEEDKQEQVPFQEH